MQSVFFQITFEKNPVAKTSKERVCFFCRSARFAVLQVLFSGSAEVAAGLSNLPLFSSYFTFCYLRLPYVYRHAETGVGGFERPAATSTDPEKRSCSTANLALRQKQHKLLYWFLPPDSFQMWFETRCFVYFVKLKHVSRMLFNLKLQRTGFHSKNAPKKCSQSSPRGPKTSPKCLRELPGDVLRGHTHLQSGPGASPIRHSGQSVINSSKVEDPRDTLWDSLNPL